MKQFFLPSVFENIKLKNLDSNNNSKSVTLVESSNNTQELYNNSISKIIS